MKGALPLSTGVYDLGRVNLFMHGIYFYISDKVFIFQIYLFILFILILSAYIYLSLFIGLVDRVLPMALETGV